MNILKTLKEYSRTKKDIIAYRTNNHILTYAQLDEDSDKLAFYLQETLGSDKSPLVVYGHKDHLMIICFLACVKSGRAYCPVDTSVPLPRVKTIIKQVNSKIVLAVEHLDINSSFIMTKDDIEKTIANVKDKIDSSNYVKPEDTYYIIFTSGSTGNPKGVQITANCLNNFISWALSLGNINQSDQTLTYINQAPFSFDLSIMDLYLSLATGGTLWTLSKDVQSDYAQLFNSLERSNANVWVSTPSFADICLADNKFCETLLPNLALFLFCGETLTNKTVSRLHSRFPNATIINTYGPTESTVAVTSVVITPEMNRTTSPLPVGVAKPGTVLKIIDSSGKSLPDSQKGEIIIIGDTVSSGYFKSPELTEKSFFLVNPGDQRAYHTGDEGYIENNLLYYCGRIDLQIKLHGYRIEIEDIENNILKVPGIRNVVVCPIYSDGKVKSLTAFVVMQEKVEDEFETAQTIKKQLNEFIPQYMVPKKFIFISSIPMTNNGKADRKKLGGMVI